MTPTIPQLLGFCFPIQSAHAKERTETAVDMEDYKKLGEVRGGGYLRQLLGVKTSGAEAACPRAFEVNRRICEKLLSRPLKGSSVKCPFVAK